MRGLPKIRRQGDDAASEQPTEAAPPVSPDEQPTVIDGPAPVAPPPEQPTAQQAAVGVPPADMDPAAMQVASAPSFRDRGRLRRRLAYLRRVRELGFRDLGGLVFDLHRFQRPGQHLVDAKLNALSIVDQELRALERVLKDKQLYMDLREPGIAACPRCAALHGSDARFCPSCGIKLSGPLGIGEVGGVPAPAPPPSPAGSPAAGGLGAGYGGQPVAPPTAPAAPAAEQPTFVAPPQPPAPPAAPAPEAAAEPAPAAEPEAAAEPAPGEGPTEAGLQAPIGIRKPEDPPPAAPAEETAAAEPPAKKPRGKRGSRAQKPPAAPAEDIAAEPPGEPDEPANPWTPPGTEPKS